MRGYKPLSIAGVVSLAILFVWGGATAGSHSSLSSAVVPPPHKIVLAQQAAPQVSSSSPPAKQREFELQTSPPANQEIHDNADIVGLNCKVLMSCAALSQSQQQDLLNEDRLYTAQARFKNKIHEAKFDEPQQDSRYIAILNFLDDHVFASGMSILDLGGAAGAMLRYMRHRLDKKGGHGRMAAVELVAGWVAAAKDIFRNDPLLLFFQGDATNFSSVPGTFDLLTMNDVMEHIQPNRYGCLFRAIKEHSHPGTAVYFHNPTPETQLRDRGQFFENAVPHHIIVSGMACAGFQLERFSYDYDTDCGHHGQIQGMNTALKGAKCIFGGAPVPKYEHWIFRMPFKRESVFDLTSNMIKRR